VNYAVEVGFLLCVLEYAWNRNVGKVVRVVVDEGEFEHEGSEVVEVCLVFDLLGLETLLEAAFAQAVVARVELEAGQRVLDDVFGHVDARLQVVEFVVACTPLEDLGRDAFVCGQEPELDAVAREFSEHLVDLRDFGVLHKAALTVVDAVAEEDHAGHWRRAVVLLPVQDAAFDDFLELEFGFIRVLEFRVLIVLDDLLGAEHGHVGRVLRQDGSYALGALAVADVHGEHHRAARHPAGHLCVEEHAVPHRVGQLHDQVLHHVQHNQPQEVALLESLAQDNLVGYTAVLMALLFDNFLLARDVLLLRPAVDDHHHDLGLTDRPILLRNVAHLHHVGVCD